MIYLMSDIHGYSELFFQMLEKLNFGSGDKMVILGDLAAKGPDSLGLLRFTEEQDNIFLLRGNHEQRLLQTFGADNGAKIPKETLVPWQTGDGAGVIKQFLEVSEAERRRLLDYLLHTPLKKELRMGEKTYVMVHGAPEAKGTGAELSGAETPGIDMPGAEPSKVEPHKAAYTVLENRYESPEADNRLPSGLTAVVGHTPTFKYGMEYAGKIIVRPDKIFLDCGAGQGHGIGCLRLDDGKEFYCRPDRKL